MNQRLLSAMVFCVFLAAGSPAHAVFIGDSNGNLYDLDVASNTSTLLGNSGVGAMYDIAQNPLTGALYGAGWTANAGYTLFSLDKTNGSATVVGATGGAFLNGLTFDSAGTLYGVGLADFYTIDLLSGSASKVGSGMGYSSSGDIAFDSSGNLYLSATGTTGDRLVSIDPLTGTGSLIGDIGFSGVYGLNFSGSTLYGFSVAGKTITIDTVTGAGTLVAANGITAYGADGAGGVQVPEPATLALLGIGLLGLGMRRNRST